MPWLHAGRQRSNAHRLTCTWLRDPACRGGDHCEAAQLHQDRYALLEPAHGEANNSFSCRYRERFNSLPQQHVLSHDACPGLPLGACWSDNESIGQPARGGVLGGLGSQSHHLFPHQGSCYESALLTALLSCRPAGGAHSGWQGPPPPARGRAGEGALRK